MQFTSPCPEHRCSVGADPALPRAPTAEKQSSDNVIYLALARKLLHCRSCYCTNTTAATTAATTYLLCSQQSRHSLFIRNIQIHDLGAGGGARVSVQSTAVQRRRPPCVGIQNAPVGRTPSQHFSAVHFSTALPYSSQHSTTAQ